MRCSGQSARTEEELQSNSPERLLLKPQSPPPRRAPRLVPFCPDPIQFLDFIYDVDEGTESRIIKFLDDS